MRSFLVAAAFGASVAILAPGIAYIDIANVFTANQRINAGLGINAAPGSTGTATLSDGIFEYSRSAKLGSWTAVSYNAGNFSQASGTWTVQSGDQTTYRYMVVGKTMFLNVRLDGTDITGSPAWLSVAVPGGFTIGSTIDATNLVQLGTFQMGAWEATSGTTTVLFYASTAFGAWSAGTGDRSIIASMSFEVQ